jgi:hypothetical protein
MQVRVHDAQYDTIFNIVFGSSNSHDRTVNFLNIILGLVGDDVIENVSLLESSRHGLNDRSVYADVCLDWMCVSKSKKRFIVEMQKAQVIGHANRWIYYASRELVSVGTGLRTSNKEITDSDARTKANQNFYADLDPVKVVCLLNFDSETLAEQLKNKTGVVVNWCICEQETKDQASSLISWTFVILPRFLKILSQMSKIDFQGEPAMYPWLYLLTRSDGEEVELNEMTCAGNRYVEESFLRMSLLSNQEKRDLEAEIDEERAHYSSLEAAKQKGIMEGKLEGIMEGKLEVKLEIARTILGKRKSGTSEITKADIQETCDTCGLHIDDGTKIAMDLGYKGDE